MNGLGLEKRTDATVDEEGHRWIEVVPQGSDTALILTHGYGGWTQKKVGGNSGLMFSVDDMASTVETLKARGVTFPGEPDSTPFSWTPLPSARGVVFDEGRLALCKVNFSLS